jgi:hypothetical protein
MLLNEWSQLKWVRPGCWPAEAAAAVEVLWRARAKEETEEGETKEAEDEVDNG